MASAVAAAECAEAAADDGDKGRMCKFRLTTHLIGITALLRAIAAPAFTFGQTPDASQIQTAAAENSFEELPELKASEILKPEILKGPHHTVREPVPTFSGANQYVIDSDYGVFDAEGNEMLMCRVREVYAIDQLSQVSRTDQFKQSLVTAAKGPYNAARNIVKDPVNTVSNVPKGVMKFLGRAGDSIKKVGKKDDSYKAEGSKLEQTLGYSKTKRQIAVSLGVDPYTTNAVLQKQLNDIAWASWAGNFAFSAGTLPIGGAAGIGLTVTSVSDSLDKAVHEKPPADLKEMNRAGLRSIGAGEKDTERFLNNTAFTPSHQTAFVLNLKALEGVSNRGGFVRSAAENSSNEADALFCVETAKLMGQIHTGEHPIDHITMLQNFPVCVAKDGTVITVLQWDYAAWTSGAAGFADEVQKLAKQSGEHKPLLIAISGQMSPRVQQELQARGFTVQDRLTPGPLK